jgi:GTP cyclohydrolase I
MDLKRNQKVAIKKNISVFPNEEFEEEEHHRLELRIIREIKTLLHCKHSSVPFFFLT